ncbi:organoarsenical effux MFS transporter ArsJ [Verrucomicrobiaceae bacterium N1E253]|uniref:Organoarsenical effux MFS transporter ArsJ n=1 Tax=Oceaniferula marina TaxID=2748318 RepID=A0A851GE66_9BACT|nr:organoarsenical effux MFS transporter ArsJ [Oceaniferula marina]NWK55716.1 organoarsenical effux MFS transporter ArsJ [Oceaniferula marina]
MNHRSYAIVTASYWGFTLTDGALRMLVLLHFHALGYSPVQLAFLFLLYEFCGVLTNLLGGWIGSRVGLKTTLFAGLGLQVFALVMLSLVHPAWTAALSVSYVMVSQALSGIAKDLTKMSSKSAVKLLVTDDSETGGALFRWVSILTGSKNALKGVGFFLGGFLLSCFGFVHALWIMAAGLAMVLVAALTFLKQDMGKSKRKVKFTQLFSKSREINWLSAARFFLFASRDVWFVVALPVYLTEIFGWGYNGVGTFMAVWVIGYGLIQASAPKFIRNRDPRRAAVSWAGFLAILTAMLALAIQLDFHPMATILIGLGLFGFAFAINSAVHSYLILSFTDDDQVALNVGFYYMANAWGRLIGTLLSGTMYLLGGLTLCLWTSAAMIAIAAMLSTAFRQRA